jgi:hypothetical protein
MLLVILGLAYGLGHALVAALRAPTEPWRLSELFWAGLLGLAATSWLGQALADAGWFSWWRLAGALLVGQVGLGLIMRRRLLPAGLRLPGRELAALGAVLLLGAGLFLRPGEITVGGRDDGIRQLAGVSLARHGGWLQRTPLSTDLPRYGGVFHVKYLGFLVADAEKDLVVPQFTGVHEVWQGIAYGWREPHFNAVDNLRAAHPWMFRLNPIMALLSLLACYMLGRSIFGHGAAIIGTGLLSLNMAQIWYSRLAMAEILFQFFLLGGLAACAAYIRRPSRVSALTAGMANGVATLTKVDGLVALAVLIGVAVLLWPQRDRWPGWGWLAAPLAALTIHYALHSQLFSGVYFSTNTTTLFLTPTLLLLGLAGLLALAAFIGLRRRYRQRFDALVRRPWSARSRITVVALALLAMAYAYFVRPSVLAGEAYEHIVWGTMVESFRGVNFVMLVAYLTPLGAGLAIIGLARHVLGPLRLEHLPALAVLAGYAVVFTYNAFIVADQPFWVRRFLPIVIPGALLAAGATLVALWRRATPGRLLSPALLAGLIGWSLWLSQPILTLRTGAGLGAAVQSFASQFPANAVVLFQDWTTGISLAAPLEIVYGREVYQFEGTVMSGNDERIWEDRLATWAAAGRPVYYVASSRETTLPDDRWGLVEKGEQTLEYAVLETTRGSIPRQVVQAGQTVTIYQLVATPPPPPPPCQFLQFYDQDDYGTLGAGWYASEKISPDQSMRWSKPEASLVVPWVGSQQPLTLTLNLGYLNPAPPPGSMIQFRLENKLVEFQPLKPGWAAYTLVIPEEAESARALSLQVEGWSPSDTGQPDARELGVAMLSMLVEQSECAQP